MNDAASGENGLPHMFNPSQCPDTRPYGYSTAAVSSAGARLAFISGQGGQDDTGDLSPDFDAQVAQAYNNLARVIEALGAKPANVLKLTVFVVDHDIRKLDTLTSNVKRLFGNDPPAQSLVPVPKLAVDPMLFEVEAVLSLP